jgi:hypothetical protein
MTTTPERLMSSRELAEACGVKVARVFYSVARGQLIPAGTIPNDRGLDGHGFDPAKIELYRMILTTKNHRYGDTSEDTEATFRQVVNRAWWNGKLDVRSPWYGHPELPYPNIDMTVAPVAAGEDIHDD